MAQLAATNVRTNRQLDGTYVEITWTDPNPVTTEIRFYKPGAAGVTPITYALAAKTAVLPAGDWEIKLVNSADQSLRTPFTAVPVAPAPLTDLAYLKLAGWTAAKAGDVFGRVTIDSDLTVQADGSIS